MFSIRVQIGNYVRGYRDILFKDRGKGLRLVKAFSLYFPLSSDFVRIIPEDPKLGSSGIGVI